MDFKQLFTEDRAVSPVIGVILMVAITVILAAVIGTFVLGLGDQVSESAPQAQFAFDFQTQGSGTDVVNITHDGGDSIPAEDLSVNVNSTTAWAADGSGTWNNDGGNWTSGNGEVSAGKSLGLSLSSGGASDGDAVRVVWASSNSDKTATIGQAQFQS
jgi:flagellin-like protein